MRLPGRKALSWYAALAMIAGAGLAGCDGATDEASALMLSELRVLLAENDLYRRPSMPTDDGVSWSASAYGFAAMRAAGEVPDSTAYDSAELTSLLEEQIAKEPIWGRWYGLQVEQAIDVDLPGRWADGIVDNVTIPQERASQIATVAAVADVVAAKSIPVPSELASKLHAYLTSALAESRSPFSWCRALDAAEELRLDTSQWTVPEFEQLALEQTFSAESLTDAYGTLCLARHRGEQVDLAQRQRIREWLRPQLELDAAGFELEAYFAATSWLLVDGERSQLRTMAARLRGRIDSDTGLMHQHVVRLGTLENTYYVALIADTFDAGAELLTADTLAAVRTTLPRARRNHSISDLLMSAVILRFAGSPDASLETEAGDLARDWLANGVKRENVLRAALVMTLLQQLGQAFEQPAATVFSVHDREDRYLAWTMLSIAHHLANGEHVNKSLAGARRQVVTALNEPYELTVREVTTAMQVPGTGVDRNQLPPALTAWATEVRGCDGFTTLYRPLRSERRCTLEATWQMMTAGLAPLDHPTPGGGT